MNDFTFYSPTEFVFGRGITDSVGEKLSQKGYKRVLLVYGKGSVVRSGTLDRVKKSLAASHIEFSDLSGVRPNPEVNQVREGIEIARSFNADCLLAVGGGSTIDCAKAISIGVPYEGDVWDFFSGKTVASECLPVCCVLTIPAAGSEGSNSCVISNDAENKKNGLGNELFRPVVSLMDPELTFTLPPYQTGAGITDMIAHICERYFSGAPAVPVTDNIACGLIRAIIDSAEKLVDDPSDYASTTLMSSVENGKLEERREGRASSLKMSSRYREISIEPYWASTPSSFTLSTRRRAITSPWLSRPTMARGSPGKRATMPWAMRSSAREIPGPSNTISCEGGVICRMGEKVHVTAPPVLKCGGRPWRH